MPVIGGYTDYDFIGDYNTANSTDLVGSYLIFLWVPAAGKYWMALDMWNQDGVTESPATFAIIDPVTKTIEGFSDETGFLHTQALIAEVSAFDGCVWVQGVNSSGVGRYYTKYNPDGTVAVQSSTAQGNLNSMYVSPVADKVFGWQNNYPSPGYQIKELDTSTGTVGSAVVTSSNYIEVSTVFDSAGCLWFSTSSAGPNGVLKKYDPSDSSITDVYTISDNSGYPRVAYYNSALDQVLFWVQGSALLISINVADNSVADSVSLTSPWATTAFLGWPGYNAHSNKYWSWFTYGTGGYGAFDPADINAEPDIYEVSDSGGAYLLPDCYQHEVCADASVYGDTDIYYVRIWPGTPDAVRRYTIVNINARRR